MAFLLALFTGVREETDWKIDEGFSSVPLRRQEAADLGHFDLS
jgi:hypothetical protein